MWLVIQFTIFLAFSLQIGVSLNCYSCYSTADFNQCDQKLERITCSPWLDVCAKSHVAFERWGKRYQVYERGCFANDFCNTKACKYIGRNFNAKACNITCCDVELCNGGSLASESKILIGLSVVLAASLWGAFKS